MRITSSVLVVLAACSSNPTRVEAPSAAKQAASDVSLFPGSWPALRDAEAATDPARTDQLARTARSQLDEERELSPKDAAHDQAYERLTLRMRIASDNALIASGRSLDALADVVRQPFECPAKPEHTRETCESLLAALGTAFPNVISGPGHVAQVDQSLVVDDKTSQGAVAAFVRKASGFQGSVVQRMRVTSASPGVVKVGALLQLRVSPKQRLGAGELMWVAFEPRQIRQTGKTWDLANAHVLFVEAK